MTAGSVGSSIRSRVGRTSSRHSRWRSCTPLRISRLPIGNREILKGVQDRHREWREDVRPTLLRMLEPTDPAVIKKEDSKHLKEIVERWATDLERGLDRYREIVQERVRLFERLVFG